MKLAILDSYALTPNDLDWSPLETVVEEIVVYPRTPYNKIIQRIGDAELAIVNKSYIDETVL